MTPQRKNDFSQGSIAKNILSLAIPLTVAQLTVVLYNVVDRAFIGHIDAVGRDAFTGIGLVMPCTYIITAFANLCGTGGAPLFSIARGQGRDQRASRIMGVSFTLLLLLGGVLTVGFYLFQTPFLYLVGGSDETVAYARSYLQIYLIGVIPVMIGLGMNPFINAQGFGAMGMLTVGLGAVVNIALDPIFIFVLHMGVRGAALATVLAQGCSAVWVLAFLTGDRALLRLKRVHLRLEWSRTRTIISLGLAGFFVNLTNALVQVVCNATLQRWGGDLYVGVMTIVNSLREVVTMPIHGLSQGSQPVMGYNAGAGKPQRVCRSIRFTTGVTLAYAAGVVLVMELFPAALIRLFNSEAEVIAAGVPAVRLYYCMYLFMSLQMVGQSTFTALGRAKNAIFFSLFRKAIVNAPLTVLLPLCWGLGTTGVFAAEAVSQLLGGLACFTTMYLVVYRPLKRGAWNPR